MRIIKITTKNYMENIEEKMDEKLEEDKPLTPEEEEMLRDMLALPLRTRFRDLHN